MSDFPSLPVLNDIVETLRAHGRPGLFEGVGFVCVQHLLESTGSLIEALIQLGARPKDIFILGKRYSSNDNVLKHLRECHVRVTDTRRPRTWQEFGKTFDHDVQEQWRKVSEQITPAIKRIVVVDDGGHCILNIPKSLRKRFKSRIVCVEQTSSGLRKIHGPFCPVINVASSAVKKYVEGPLVAKTVLQKSLSAVGELDKAANVGIIGLGSIGTALAKVLSNHGKQIFGYDINGLQQNVSPVQLCNSVSAVLQRADVIFGCTGENLPIRRLFDGVTGRKVLISCSSEDREFSSLIQQYYRHNPSAFRKYEDDIPLKYKGADVRIIRGGFPVNFDGTRESVPSDDIQVTRGLLLGAVVQALTDSCTTSAIYNLDAGLQQFVVNSWLKACPGKELNIDNALLQSLDSPRWIEKESGNTPRNCPMMSDIFECKPVGSSAAIA